MTQFRFGLYADAEDVVLDIWEYLVHVGLDLIVWNGMVVKEERNGGWRMSRCQCSPMENWELKVVQQIPTDMRSENILKRFRNSFYIQRNFSMSNRLQLCDSSSGQDIAATGPRSIYVL
jgi:hypothetical protein